MPFPPDTLSKLTTRLNQAKGLSLNDANAALNNYQDVFNAVINEELTQEISLLDSIITNEEGDAAVLFEQRCQERALQNKDTCLSLLEMPLGACNQLYCDFIHIIYPTATMADYLRLLLPEVALYLTPEFDNNADGLNLNLVEKPLSLLDETFSQEKLSDLLLANGIVFNVKDICFYDFKWHQEFFQRINQEYPSLAKLIYEHNSDLKTLANYLRMISDKGQILLDVLNQLIKELRRGGETITGETLASISTAIAVTNFFGYVDALPVDTKNTLLALHSSDDNKNLSDILNQLKNLECVETAANQLEDIIKYQKARNMSILYQVPNMSKAVYDAFQNQYKKGAFISSMRELNNSILPSCYLEKIFSRLSIKEMPEIVIALLSFPIDMYSIVLKNKLDKPEHETVYQLANIINIGILSGEQINAIYDTLLLNLDAFHIDNALDLTIATNAIDIVAQLFSQKSENDRFNFLCNIDEINPDLPRIEVACRNPQILKTLLELLSFANQKKLIEETLLISHAIENHETLKMLYDLYSKEVFSDAVKSDDFWYFLVRNTNSLSFILSIYSAEEIMDLCQTDTKRAYLLFDAFENPSSVQLLLPLYNPQMLTKLILNTYYDNERSMRSCINKIDSDESILSFNIIMGALSEKQKIEVISFREINGNSLLHDTINEDDKFINLISFFSDKKECFDQLKKENNRGLTVIHHLLIDNPSLLEKLFKLMPDMPWFSAFQEKNRYGNTLIQSILMDSSLSRKILAILSNMPLDIRFIFLAAPEIKSILETLRCLHLKLNFIFPVDKKTADCLDLDALIKRPLAEATKEAQGDLLIKYLAYPQSSQPLHLLLDYLLDIVSTEDIMAWTLGKNNSYPMMIHYPSLLKRCPQLSCWMPQEQHVSLSTGFFWETNSPRNPSKSSLMRTDRDFITPLEKSEPPAKKPKFS